MNQNLSILNNIITHSRTGFSEYIKNDVFANILPSYIYAVLITVIIYVSDEVESYRDTKPADFLYVIMIIFLFHWNTEYGTQTKSCLKIASINL